MCRIIGKGKWQPIEHGMIEWRSGMTRNDPAGDLANVTLTLPTPPPSMYAQRTASYKYQGRTIRPFPKARMPSSATSMPRIASITMAETEGYHQGLMSAPTQYTYQVSPPMYGEDQVPMSVQMPQLPVVWEGERGVKRGRSDEGSDGEVGSSETGW
jgi:hypothetical protein